MPISTGVRSALKPSKPKILSSQSIEHPKDQNISNRKLSPDRKSSVAVMDIFRKDHGKEKRNSVSMGLGVGRSSSPAKSSPKNSPKLAPSKPAKMAIEMESPPLVFYGSVAQSSGALMSGSILLTVTDPEIRLQTFEMNLVARVVFKKPVQKDCPSCTTKDTIMFKWKFLTEPTKFTHGIHTFPFSYLLPGHVPATCINHLAKLGYVLEASAVTSLCETIDVSRTLVIQRALNPTGDKTSVRIFPPTNLTVRVVHPSVLHPIGEFPVQMTLNGVIDKSLKNIERRWRIRRLNWRIEEKSRNISAACPKHAPRVGGEGKGILHEDVRTLAHDDVKNGWKTDFGTEGGSIEFEFTPSMKPTMDSCCDVSSPNGLEVSHKLHLEIIVVEEQTSGLGQRAAPTGSARVLRMEFKLLLTERSGMGISWDEEMPPMYEDVPNSPPGYIIDHMEDDLGEGEELDGMHQ